MFSRQQKLTGVAVAVLGVLGLLFVFGNGQRPASEPAAQAKAATAAPVVAPRPVPVLAAIELSAEDRAFVEALRAKFARSIHSPHARIKAIEQLMAYLVEHYPDDWQGRMREFLAQLFPELSAALYAAFEKLLGYNDWLREQRESLMQLPPQERRRALWEARRAAFGANAELIWRGEIRNEKVVDALAAVDQVQGRSTDEKFALFLGAIEQAYGEDAPQFIASSQTELLGRFLAVPSVQAELAAMPRAQQRAALRRVRTAAGLDDAALQRWDELDATRDQAWDRGQSYQLQRSAILAQGSAAEQQQRLTALQNEMFGAEAETIRSEEESGFFRYANPRRIGRE